MNPSQFKPWRIWFVLAITLALLSLACNAPGLGLNRLAAELDQEELQAALEDLPAEELLEQLEQDPQFQQLLEQGLSPDEILEQLEELEGFEGMQDLQDLGDLSDLEGLEQLGGELLGEGLPGFPPSTGAEPPPEVLAGAAQGGIPMCTGEYECDSLGYLEYQDIPLESQESSRQKWCVHIQYEVRERDQDAGWSPTLYLGVASLDPNTGWEFTPNLYLTPEAPRSCAEVIENDGG